MKSAVLWMFCMLRSGSSVLSSMIVGNAGQAGDRTDDGASVYRRVDLFRESYFGCRYLAFGEH